MHNRIKLLWYTGQEIREEEDLCIKALKNQALKEGFYVCLSNDDAVTTTKMLFESASNIILVITIYS